MDGSGEGSTGVRAWETRSKSFNAHPGDTHVSFSVLDMALHPSGRLIACVTGDHASGGERVLVYGTEPDEVSAGERSELARQSQTGPVLGYLELGRGLAHQLKTVMGLG